MYGNTKCFKWWFIKGITNYQKLLEEKTAQLIAMTREEEIIQKIVPLGIEGGLVIADCGSNKGRFYLTPNQMVSMEGSLKGYWLADASTGNRNTPLILGTYVALEDNRAVMLPKGEVKLFGKPSGFNATVVTRSVEAIIPIGDGYCIAYEEGGCIIVGDREVNETEIDILMKRMS